MRTRNCWFIFFISLFLSCGVKQPIERTTEQPTGMLFVTSSPPGGVILLDHQPTGKTTPDTLFNISAGAHVVQVRLAEYVSTPDSFLAVVEANQVHHVDFSLQKIIRFGQAAVATTPAGAAIFINDQPTGQTTPDTLTLQPGPYVISAQLNGFTTQQWHLDIVEDSLIQVNAGLAIQQRVLFEGFANVSCTPCVEASHNLDRFRQEMPPDQFVMLEYYANWPSPNDPFYKAAPQDAKQRILYYGLTSLPSLFINGVTGVDAAQYENIVNSFQTAYADQKAQTAISLSRRLEEDRLKVKVDLYQFDPENSIGDRRLFVAIIENEIHFDAPPGSNGLVDFNTVFRGFLSSRQGDLIEPQEHQSFAYDITWPAFVFENSQIIAFVQNIATKRIIQTTIN